MLTIHTTQATVTLKDGYTVKGETVYVAQPYGTPQYFAYVNGAARVYVTQLPDGTWRER